MKTLINKIRKKDKKDKKQNSSENRVENNIKNSIENSTEKKKRFTYEKDTLKIKPKKGVPINISLPPVMNSLDILMDKDIRETIMPPLAVSGLLKLYSKYDNRLVNDMNNNNFQILGTLGAISSLYYMKKS